MVWVPLNIFQKEGANYSVFVNTGNEFDGSDSGARPDEAISWGKIMKTADPVKVSIQKLIIFFAMCSIFQDDDKFLFDW